MSKKLKKKTGCDVLHGIVKVGGKAIQSQLFHVTKCFPYISTNGVSGILKY